MARKVLTFISLSIALLLINILLMQNNQPKGNQANNGGNEEEKKDGDADADDEKLGAGADANEHPIAAPPPHVPTPPAAEPERATLGSLNPDDDYVMLVTANNLGGTIERIELNNPRFQNLSDRREGLGYVGYLGPRDTDATDAEPGIKITVVGKGTPAEAAELQVGEIIQAVKPGEAEEIPITSVLEWESLLANEEHCRVGAVWVLTVVDADGNKVQRDVTLGRVPLSIVAPVTAPNSAFPDPQSLLLTLQKISNPDGENVSEIPAASSLMQYLTNGADGIIVGKLPADHALSLAGLREGNVLKKVDNQDFDNVAELEEYLLRVPTGSWLQIQYGADGIQSALVRLPAEMPEMNLHNVTWELNRPAGQDNVIEFQYTDPRWQLRYTKRFTLAKKSEVEESKVGGELPPCYHLIMDLAIENLGAKRELVYQLEGFNGLPDEGWWYSSKLARNWFEGVGARDVLFEFQDRTPDLIGAPRIAKFDDLPKPGGEVPLRSVSSDARYFAGSLIPIRDPEEEATTWFQRAMAVRVGAPRGSKELQLTNTSFRLLSTPIVLETGESYERSFRLFAGPKSTELLADSEYQLSELVYYGWPIWGFFAKILQGVLHFIYSIIPNYGVAILILTVMVRGAMFPLSRKNALGAQKMQMLQPEIRRLNEKYKNNPQEKMRATQELFRKHNYHPLGGCLVLFLQLPIFIGLYRALMLDVELRQAPLIPGFTGWCDNLAAPDMLFDWSKWSFMPDLLVAKTGFLGPYFNLLPILTIGLFIAQQKMFMPPALDDQQRMQQKMMKYMMVFFAFMFFKVPAGLCLYFIASSLWGLAERKFLPKPNKDQQALVDEASAGPSPRERRKLSASGGNGSSPKPGTKNKKS